MINEDNTSIKNIQNSKIIDLFTVPNREEEEKKEENEAYNPYKKILSELG